MAYTADMRVGDVEYEMVQFEVIPNEQPLGDPYVIVIPSSGDEDGNPLPSTKMIRALTIPVRTHDPRITQPPRQDSRRIYFVNAGPV